MVKNLIGLLICLQILFGSITKISWYSISIGLITKTFKQHMDMSHLTTKLHVKKHLETMINFKTGFLSFSRIKIQKISKTNYHTIITLSLFQRMIRFVIMFLTVQAGFNKSKLCLMNLK